MIAVVYILLTMYLGTNVIDAINIPILSPVPIPEGVPNPKFTKIPGDIVLGGLFPMHEKGTGGSLCGAIKEEKGIQRLEAMLYAIDQINADDNILYNITLGAHILDTCLRDTFALEQSLDFVKAHMTTLDSSDYRCHNGESPTHNPTKPVAGVIGAASSLVSIMVANILRLFKIPQISYASTAIALSDKSRFEYFSRVVPPDTLQARAMVDIVKKFGWTYVATLADEGNYGEKGIAAFEEIAENNDICIERSLKIAREVDRETFVSLLKTLSKAKAKVIVMFVNEDNCRRLIRAALETGHMHEFYWLASDSWGAKIHPVEGQEEAAEGTVTILPQRKILDDFDAYFKSLRPRNNTRNPWFREFWEKHFQCRFHENNTISSSRRCTGNEQISQKSRYRQEGLVPFVLDAVYAIAHALDDLKKRKCSYGQPDCASTLPLHGRDVLSAIRNVSFIGATGNTVEFDENGDAPGRYTIYQYQRHKGSPGSFHYLPIGNWSNGIFQLDVSAMRWKNNSMLLPTSLCSMNCSAGFVRSSVGCCWKCIECNDDQVAKNIYSCEACDNGSYPDPDNRTICKQLPIQHLALDSIWAIVPAVFSAMGILATLFVIVVFIRFNRTPVIMASGRELCYVLLFGFIFSYSMTYLMVTKPTRVVCTLLRLGLGLSLSICYAALFTKTNRISRIFNRGVKAMVKRPSYTSPRSQLVICSCLVAVQGMGAATWLVLEIPGTTHVYPDRLTVVLRCKTTNLSIVLSLMYNMVLIVMCTVYAFKTRKIPENYNEAKYIAFTMYSTCIVWLAFIPIFFGTKNDFKIQITALCMCVSISATVALGCLFGPKVYIVLFQPHKNVRTGVASALNPGTSRRTLFGRPSSRSVNGDVTSPTGLALLIAQSTVQIGKGLANNRSPARGSDGNNKHPATRCDFEPIKDLELESSGPETSEPETNI